MARELVAEARASGLEVVLAGGSDALAERLGDVERTAAGQVAAELAARQSAGHVVVFVSGRAHRGLRTADVGIGVQTPGRRAPVSAHLIVKEGLGQAWILLAAMRRARAVSRRSALIALAGATTGGVWALAGPGGGAARRAMLAVNSSALLSMANGAVAGVGLAAVVPPRPPARTRWHELDAPGVLRLVGSNTSGLDPHDREQRRRAETARVERTPVSLARAAVDELANPLTPLLGLGAALSAATGSLTDAGLVLGVVGINSLVGAAQRTRTEHDLIELERNGRTSVQVLAQGSEHPDPLRRGGGGRRRAARGGRHRSRRLPRPERDGARGRRVGADRRVAAGGQARGADAGRPGGRARLDALRGVGRRRGGGHRGRRGGRSRHRSRTQRRVGRVRHHRRGWSSG